MSSRRPPLQRIGVLPKLPRQPIVSKCIPVYKLLIRDVIAGNVTLPSVQGGSMYVFIILNTQPLFLYCYLLDEERWTNDGVGHTSFPCLQHYDADFLRYIQTFDDASSPQDEVKFAGNFVWVHENHGAKRFKSWDNSSGHYGVPSSAIPALHLGLPMEKLRQDSSDESSSDDGI